MPLPPTTNRSSVASAGKITLHHGETVAVEFFTDGNYGKTPEEYGEYGDWDILGKGMVSIGGRGGVAELRFGVGGPSRKTQAIFFEYFHNADAAEDLRMDHGILINRQYRNDHEVLGDMAFV